MDLLINYLQSGFSAVVPFVVLLGILIFVHELGHFLVAKWCGVRVETFSLGFGRKIFKYKRGDTTYALSLVPLGGYVKMFGDEYGKTVAPGEQKYSFSHKSVWQRIAIVLAGPLMNFFFAILIFLLVSVIGEEFRKPVVGDIPGHSQAYKAGFRSGDTVQTVAGHKVRTWDEFQSHINNIYDESVKIEVLRESSGQPAAIEATPHLRPNPNILSLDETVGEIEGLSPYSKAAVVAIKHNSIASQWGLKTGDHVLTINGKEVSFLREIENILLSQQDQNVEIKFERQVGKKNVEQKISTKVPRIASIKALGMDNPELFVGKIVPDSPAAAAGLQDGDRLLKIGTAEPTEWEDILTAVKSYSGEGTMVIQIEREGEVKNFNIAPKLTVLMTPQGSEEKRYTIGIKPMLLLAPPGMTTVKADGPVAAFNRGVERTFEITGMTVLGFLRLVQNKISPKNIGGVISIGQAASETFKIGIGQFLQMMAIISVNLFVLNLLPIPVLDGGHLLFYCIEALRGAPVSMRKMEVAQQVGLVLLVSLMVFALFNDFSRIFGFW